MSHDCYAKILSYVLRPASTDPFGKLTGGELQMSVRCKTYTAKDVPWVDKGIREAVNFQVYNVFFRPDYPDGSDNPDIIHKSPITFAYILRWGIDNDWLAILALRRSVAEPEKYVRIGLLDVYAGLEGCGRFQTLDILDFAMAERRTITII